MRFLLAIALAFAPEVAHAQFGTDGIGTVYVPSGPAFAFVAPAAGAYGTLTASRGQTITCARASSAGYVTAATYSAATQPSTNVFLQSGSLHDAAWNNVANTVANVGIAPDGTNSLTQINASCSFQNGQIQSNFTNTGPFTVSGYFQQADVSNTTAGLYGYCGAVAVTSCTCQRDDATACTASSAGLGGTICTATSTVGATTARFSLTWSCATPPAGGGAALCSGAYPGSGSIKAWGGQAEDLGVETNYIPTVAGTVSRGLVQMATTNQCAVDYRGLQVEGGLTNLALRSEAFDNAAWTKSAGVVAAPTVTANQVIAPDGNLTADQIAYPTVVGAAAFSEVSEGFTATAASYTLSVWLKKASGSSTVYLATTPDGVTWGRTACTVTTTWTRCTTTRTLTAATWFFTLGVDLRDGSQSTQSAQTIFAWGAQAELSPFATSYIATAGTSVARAGDTISLTKPSNVQMAGSGAQYSLSVTAQLEGLLLSNQEAMGSNASFVPLLKATDTVANEVAAFSDTAPTAATVTLTDATKVSQANRYQMSVSAGKLQVCAAGSCSGLVTVGAQPAEPTILYPGSFGGAVPLFGWMPALCLSRVPTTGCPAS